jgi:methionyl-tRNA formyltransferase
MGTPEFAVPCLEALCDSDSVCAVFTQPDKPKGRGNKVTKSPVKEYAESRSIPVFQPMSLRRGDDAEIALKTIESLSPDLIIVTAYGQILPESILTLPKYGCINMHASILPKLRGAAPIQYALLNGDKRTGVTSQQMGTGLDTGDMLITETLTIGEDETAPELTERLSKLAAKVMADTIIALKSGSLNPVKQIDSDSTYAPMIQKEMSLIDFSGDIEKENNKIKAITGYAFFEGKRIKILRSFITDKLSKTPVGTLISEGGKLFVNIGGKLLGISELQLEGGKKQTAEQFLPGHKITDGMVLTDE